MYQFWYRQINGFVFKYIVEQKIDMKEFILALKNKTNQKGKGIVLKQKGKPVAVLISYDDYLDMIKKLS